MIKKLFSQTLLIASGLLSALFLHDAIKGLTLSEIQIQESLRGAAYEDVFGFGYWPFLVAFASIQIVLIGLSRAIGSKPRWLLATAIVASFSLVLWTIDFQRIKAIWINSALA